MASTGGLSLAAAERVVHGVHRHAAHMRLLAQPPVASGLADGHVLVIEIADLPNGCDALDMDLADFTRGHPNRRIVAFPGDELHRRTRAPRNLSTLAGTQFHVV